MKRHDTHLLTEESENKKEEEEHQYSFTSSSEKSSDTHQNYVLNEQKQKSPIKLNFNDNNNNFNNNSIISSSELEDIFNGDNNNINNNKIKPKKKQIKQKINKLFVKLKKVKINPDNNDILIDHNLTYNPLPNYDNLSIRSYQNIHVDETTDTPGSYPILGYNTEMANIIFVNGKMI